MKKLNAFTLVELMVVILVIGIIAAVAVPAYKEYITKSKMAEAYQSVEVLAKKEISFFYENKEFKTLAAPNPQELDPAMVITNVSWDSDWLPMPNGSHAIFSYAVGAGKTDESGTELITSALNPSILYPVGYLYNYVRRTYASGALVRCNNLMTAASLGAVSVPNYNYVLIGATADLNNDVSTTCTSVLKLVEASPATGLVPSKSGFILLNVGD